MPSLTNSRRDAVPLIYPTVSTPVHNRTAEEVINPCCSTVQAPLSHSNKQQANSDCYWFCAKNVDALFSSSVDTVHGCTPLLTLRRRKSETSPWKVRSLLACSLLNMVKCHPPATVCYLTYYSSHPPTVSSCLLQKEVWDRDAQRWSRLAMAWSSILKESSCSQRCDHLLTYNVKRIVMDS